MSGTTLGRTAGALLAAFAALAALVRLAGEVPGDAALAGHSAQGRIRTLALAVDGLTGYGGAAVLTALVVVLLVRLGRRGDAALSALSVAGALAGGALLKRLVARPRPELLPASAAVSSYSFPSGHATVTAALAVTVVLAARGTRGLAPAAVAATLLLLGAAAAQLVLGLHRVSDVLGGWLWAGAWTSAVWAAAARRRGR